MNAEDADQWMSSNPTISADEIRRLKLKEGLLGSGMKALLDMKSGFGGVVNQADLAVYYASCLDKIYLKF